MQKRLKVSAGRARPQAPLRIRPLGIRQAGLPRPGGGSHRLAGSWAYDHGVAAHLSCNASTRVNVLTIVSAIRQSVQACAAGRGWPDLRLRELRVCAYFVREIHRRFRLRERRLSSESSWSGLRSRNPRFASANHSARRFGGSATRYSSSAVGTTFGLGQNGKGLRARRESSDSGEPLAVRNAVRGSVPP